jgi:hypothetical protein
MLADSPLCWLSQRLSRCAGKRQARSLHDEAEEPPRNADCVTPLIVGYECFIAYRKI